MVAATFVSLHLARFDQLRAAGPVDPGDRLGLLFCEVGADCRAAGTDPASRDAFTFLVVGLHDSEASADSPVEDVGTVAPWFADAVERWSGVLAPFRTKGESNLIHPMAPACLFHPLVAAPAREAPVVVFTTAGWNRDGLDMARVQDFGTGVAAVRISMTAVPGLRSQQTFFFPGIIALDPPTLTFWDNEASLAAWAHRQPSHKRQMDRYRATGNADRASFTRLAALRSRGRWHGGDTVAMARAHGLDASGSQLPASSSCRLNRVMGMVGARGIAPPPTTFRSRCASRSRRRRSSWSAAHDAPVFPPPRRTRHRP